LPVGSLATRGVPTIACAQVAGPAGLHDFPTQAPLEQSALATQAFPSVQAGHCPPPQSTSVSFPLFVPSVQPGVMHRPAVHLPSRQSLAAQQPFGAGHLGQLVPPQSMSDSVPFWSPSEQLGAAHFCELHT